MKTTDPTTQAFILDLAKKHFGIETLETRNMDGLDFHDTAVWSMKHALEEAYAAGYEARAAESKPATKPARYPEVSTDPYEESHGKPPRGRGSWAFCPAWAEHRGDYIDFTRFFNGTYAEARKEAQRSFYGEKAIVALP